MAIFGKGNNGHPDANQAWQVTADDGQSFLPSDQGVAERAGFIVSMIAFVVAVFLFALWADSRSSFERCAALTDISARSVCYEEVRQQELRPPVKGANAPAVIPHSKH